MNVPATKQILPSEVKDLENTELESDLVAPVPGEKPLVAKYTLRVKPKLVKGVPQMQEIRIMPPNKSGAGFVKPLMVLKQNITKPMIENIEIDVPKKGDKFSRKPSVEVIEGDHKETLEVSKGQAIVEDPAVQKSNTKPDGMSENSPPSLRLLSLQKYLSKKSPNCHTHKRRGAGPEKPYDPGRKNMYGSADHDGYSCDIMNLLQPRASHIKISNTPLLSLCN